MKKLLIVGFRTMNPGIFAIVIVGIIFTLSCIAGCQSKNSVKDFPTAARILPGCDITFDFPKTVQSAPKKQTVQNKHIQVFKGKINNVPALLANHDEAQENIIPKNDVAELAPDTVRTYDAMDSVSVFIPDSDDVKVFVPTIVENINLKSQTTLMDDFGIDVSDSIMNEKETETIVLELHHLDANVDYLVKQKDRLEKKIARLKKKNNKKKLGQKEIELKTIEEELAFFQPMLDATLEKLHGVQVAKADQTVVPLHIHRLKANLRKSK